ncbi:MAG: tRNA lysidine(34) synthetase TilS [Nocardioidaceae bacterium]
MSTRRTTGRLHPAVADVRRAVRDGLADLGPGRAVLVACSGGADSMALAAATSFEGARSGWVVRAVVVDHALQTGSRELTSRIVTRLGEIGIERVDEARVTVEGAGGPEAAARRARYAALSAAADMDDSTIVLGHTMDDQAETVLLGLGRGSGLRSLAGMAAVSGRHRRPLLGLRREVTRDACEAQGIEVYEDPHNVDPRFSRVRVRQELLPALEDVLGPGVVEALARTATAARDDADVLDVLAAELLAAARESGGLRVDVLAAGAPALRRRALRQASLDAGAPAGDLFAVHVGAVDRLLTNWHGQAPIDLPGGVSVVRRNSALWFRSG